MARKKRVKSSTGVYHVMLRGINKQNIFFNEDDYVKMMYILHDIQYVRQGDGRVISSDVCTIYAYCILDNHLHVLIQEGDLGLSDIMKKIEDRYASYYNQKYSRVGHLFQGRFPSEPVEDSDYFHRLLRYIHRNPVKAMEADSPEKYPYSSWNEYVNHKSNIVKVLKPDAIDSVLNRFSLTELIEWVNSDVNDQCMDMDSFKDVISDKESFETLADLSGIANPEDFRLLDPATQIHYLLECIDNGISLRQASRLGTITYSQIRTAYQRKTTQPADFANGEEIYQSAVTNIEGLGKGTRHRMHVIVKFLQSHPYSTRKEIASHLDLNIESTRRLLVRLQNENVVTCSGTTKSRTYTLKSVQIINHGV